MDGGTNPNETAAVMASPKKGNCRNCGKPGHWWKECRAKRTMSGNVGRWAQQ